MDAIDAHDYENVVAVMGAQMAKTDSVANSMGRRLQDDPVPILYIAPTRDFVEDTWEPRFRAMVKSCGVLWQRLIRGRREKKTVKWISGVKCRFGWAGSATQLAGEPACLVYLDERDRMKDNIGGEGDPKTLADNRRATYADGKTVVTSTPLIGSVETFVHPVTGLEHWAVADPGNIQSPTWRLWQQGTRHEWAWPCPHCHDYFVPRFKLLWWPKDKQTGKSCPPDVALLEAKLVCPHCGVLIDEQHKDTMNAKGRYAAPGQKIEQDGTVHGDPPRSNTISFWVSGLCSPWKSWGQRAYDFLQAVAEGDPDEIQAVINTGFGELYSVKGEAPSEDAVKQLRLPYRYGDHVAGVVRVTAGVDVQKDRLIYAVRGWGLNMESWLLQHGELFGDTKEDDVWNALELFRDKMYCGKPIELMFIDSGFRTSRTYSFCRKHLGWSIPTKGQRTMSKPTAKTFVDISPSGRRLKSGLAIWNINTDFFKRWIHERLERDPELPGGWHISEDTDDDYCRQVVAEARVVKPSGEPVWVRIRRENHFFDCEALNLAAAHVLNLPMMKDAPGRPRGAEERRKDEAGTDPFTDRDDFGGWFNHR